MPRYNFINGERVQFTAEEEAARDAVETAYANKAAERKLANVKQIRLVKHGGKKTVNQHNFLLYQLQIRDLTIGPMFGHEDIWIPVHLFFWIG